MKLILLSLVAAVVAEEAVVVEAAAAANTAPQICNCKPEVAKCVTKCENTIKHRDAEAAAKCQESLTSAKTQSQKQSETQEQKITHLDRQLTEAQALIKTLQSDSSTVVNTLKSNLDTQKAMYEAKVQEERARTDRNLAESARSLQDAQTRVEIAEANEANVRQDLKNQKRENSRLREKIENFEGVIFSRAHLEIMGGNIKTLVHAVGLNLKDNVYKLFNGVDVFELMRLQSLVMYSKMEPHVKQAKAAYMTLADHFELDRRVSKMRRGAAPYVDVATTLVDQYMERVVRSLSRSNPQVRKMFPESFTDRLIAFTYLGVVGYIASNILSAVFSAIFYPFRAMRSRKRKTCSAPTKKAGIKTPLVTTTRATKISNDISAGNSASVTDVTSTPR